MSKLTPAAISRVLWALVLVSLPVTSFRFMPFMGAGTYVRPLALYPLALLIPILIFRIWRGEISRPWPGSLTILLAFLLAGLAATAFGATLAPLELRGVDFNDRALRAAVTLVIGLAFFAASVWMNQSQADLKFSVRWLLLGLVTHLTWGALQFVGLNQGYRKQLLQIQNIFSVRGLVKNKRISGFAYEPSWLAGQIATLYLPWLVAAVLMRYRALTNESDNPPARWRAWIEPALLLAALTGLLMTYSRSGLAIAALASALTFVLAGRDSLRASSSWVAAGFNRQRWTNLATTIKIAGSRVLLALLLLAVLAGAAVFLADKGYIAAFFKADTTDLLSYAQDVYLGPRLAYAAAALTAFEAHPLTGVGLGASGFWIYQNTPDWILSGQPEIARQLSPNSSLYPNPKNLYIRLLAETGLIGFMLFLAFYLSMLAEPLRLLHSSSNTARWLAAAGIFALTAIALQGISQDSFVPPEMWINLGILAGAAGAFTDQQTQNPKGLS